VLQCQRHRRSVHNQRLAPSLRPPFPDRRRNQRQRPWVRQQRNQFLPFTTDNGDRQTSVCSETIDAAVRPLMVK